MSWIDDYKSKSQTAEQAVRMIRSGDKVYYGGNAAVPKALVNALVNRAEELENVQLNHVLLLGKDPLSAPEMEGHFRHNSLFVGPADRSAVNECRADYVPVFLHQIPRLFTENIIPLDVTMVSVSPPDEHGFMSLGVETLASKAACHNAKTVIVQVNEKMPRVLGDCFLHVSRVQSIVEHTEALPTLKLNPATDVEMAIGQHIVGLIQPGATIQMGIGGIPDAVYASIRGSLDLGIHTEMISDGAMQAIERGAVTGNRKTIHPGKVLITFALGSEELYDFLDNNPLIEAHPVEYLNDPVVISQNDNMVAINSAIEIDLTGQVCSDSLGSTIYSGFGGQVDFIRGAARSKGGKPIIAIPATAKNGTLSRIVPFLKPGAGVVTTRADVHYVVTEFGAVDLFGKNRRERAVSLIKIAHPDFQQELENAAREMNLLF
ncbi:MAG: 4-hydroxybutyrate CoA-transferase [Candidatus Eisenbacteria bacterium]|uniref:4-hydroxybutyrate CoA-transferase n=1 Tax=Eiseniibacteriota bacterium TaxID=2212470 RepID=A0A948RWU5_UNCEI|nr:4-hydroxybutyrate CoA-transferase [Candidatus Eisenbacteria bacterium]MBU1951107.1 4-hydroxybutyrate CoA-transferase [Candidatus Eisenbacteria bacterium]MBU2692493.1 4-hydroxybutyrate CoA-transferase [Candidatus Eisenbacteria bacterium]